MTDAQVGIATVIGPPLAWYDSTNGEIGDICNAQQGSYTANGTTYTIQLEFSNSANNCVNFPVVSGPELHTVRFPQQLDRNAGKQRQLHYYRDSERRIYWKRIALHIGPAERRDCQLWHESNNRDERGDFHRQLNRNHRNVIRNDHRHVRNAEPYDIDFPDREWRRDAELLSLGLAQQFDSEAGKNGSSTITVTPSGGFTGSVTLSNSALPSGVTASFGTNPTTSTSVLTFTASSTATVGTSTITVTGVSGSLSHTTTISLTISSSATSTNLIVNGGFETGAASPWTLTTGVLNNSTAEPAHTGSWDAWLDGYGTTHTDSATQTVTIPSTATTANLVFWLHIDTAETTTTTAFDKLTVQVLNSSNTVLATLGTFSNLNHATGYQQHTFSVLSFKGQTVKIRFTGTEDTSLQTSFVLDDIALNVQ